MNRDYNLEYQTALDYVSRQNFKTSPDFFKNTLGELVHIMQTFHREIDAAKQGGEFTESGIRNTRIKLARKALDDLKARQEKVVILDRRIQGLEGGMKPKPKSTEDALISYLRQREIRDSLKGLDPLEIKALYLQATDNDGFAEVADAIESAPALPGRQPLLSKKDLEEGKRIRLERDNPDAAKEIKELSAVRSVINGFLLPSIKEIETELGQSEDPLAKQATRKE